MHTPLVKSVIVNQTLTLPTPPSIRPDDPPAVWDQLWAKNPSHSKDDAHLEREASSDRWTTIVDRIEKTFGSLKGLSSIELGSGRGDFSALLAPRGVKVTLLDASTKALDQAKHRFDRLGIDAQFTTGDLLGDLKPWRGQYDLSLSSGVIEHFKGANRSRVVSAHHEVLAPGGLSIMSVPNAWCVPYRVWKFYLELRGWWPYGMEIPYSPKELVRRARAEGFESVHPQCFGFWESLRIHWMKGLFRCDVDWPNRVSYVDKVMGLALVVFARRTQESAAVRG